MSNNNNNNNSVVFSRRGGAGALVLLAAAFCIILSCCEHSPEQGQPNGPQDELEEVERLSEMIKDSHHHESERRLLPIAAAADTSLRPLSAGSNNKGAAPVSKSAVRYDELDGVKPRAFEAWNHELPCDKEDDNYYGSHDPADTGYLFLKPYKTGSSTAAGVNLRMAWNIAKHQNKSFEMCRERSNHVRAVEKYNERKLDKSYLWTIVRDPTTRLVSEFFHFRVSRQKVEPTMEHFIAFARNVGNYYLDVLPTQHDVKDKRKMVNDIIKNYNFIGVTERMHESFVAMSMLMDLPLSDFLYLNAKIHGGYDDGGWNHQCTYIVPSFLTPGMRTFLESNEWKEISRWDRALHRAATRSLDMTIETIIGRAEFEKRLEQYEKALKEAQTRCRPRTIFPCSEDGELRSSDETDCIFLDSGCAFDCLDEVATEHGLW